MQWLFLTGLLLYIGSTLVSLLPVILSIVAVTVAVCCIYALLPPFLRLPTLELWLDPDWQAPVRDPPPSIPSSPLTPSVPPSSRATNKSPPQPHFHQPTLDFERVTKVRSKLPNRDQLIAALKSRVIGQDQAIEKLVRFVIGRLAASDYSKPLVVILPGWTGTGKTELCKALAAALGVKPNRFDMGEYQDGYKSSNLMGSSIGYAGSERGGALPNALRQSQGICILHFDEVEKAHPDLWRQLLAFFDEGIITDTLGTITAPKNTICLLTSNLEAEEIDKNPEQAKEILRKSNFFSPEFMGRVSAVVPLLRLSKADSAELTVMLAKRVATHFGFDLIIEQEAFELLVTETFEESQKYGGRGIEDKINELLIDDLVDLQGSGSTQARLIVVDEKLQLSPLD